MKTDCGTRAPSIDRLVVRPKRAFQMLDCGNTHGYELVKAGELESFLDGRSRKITVESIHRYIGRKLAAASPTDPAVTTATHMRRRGRPPKRLTAETAS